MVHSLGYQVTSKYIIGQRDLFIPWNQVQSIFINEVIIRVSNTTHTQYIYLLGLFTAQSNLFVDYFDQRRRR
jgi:hypothetical protein